MIERYKVTEGSDSGHCCFEFTIVDTQTPHPVFSNKYDWICECYSREVADLICSALNRAFSQ